MGAPFTRYLNIPREANETGVADAPTFNAAMDFLDGLFHDGTLFGAKEWKAPVANVASLPLTGNMIGDARVTLDTFQIYIWTGSAWQSPTQGAVRYMGVWDALTNTPTLSDGTGIRGHYYVVSVGGTQDLGSGPISFSPGDWVIHNGAIWEKADHTESVISVFGRQGVVVAQSGDYSHSQIAGVGINDHHARDHRATHILGAADAFLSTDLLDAVVRRLRETGGPTDLLVAAIADGQYLARSGSNITGVTPSVFGQNEQRNAQEATASVTGTLAWTTLHTWTTGALPIGTYKVMWSYEWGYSVTNRYMQRRVQVNGTTIRGPLAHQKALAYPATNETTGYGFFVLAAPGTLTVNLDVMPANVTDTAYIERSRFEIIRVQ